VRKHPFHFDAAAIERAIAAIEAQQLPNEPGIVGMTARFNLAVLRPFFLAMVGEINGGATANELRRAAAGAIANLVLSVADTNSNQVEPRRGLEVAELVLLVTACVREIAARDNKVVASVRGEAGGRA
jgi:hypothetical protein